MRAGYLTLNEAEIKAAHSMFNSAVRGMLNYLEKNKFDLNPWEYDQTRLDLIRLLKQNEMDLNEDLSIARQYRRMVI